MDTNIPAEGMHYNSATTMPKPMQSVGPVQAQCSYYGLSVEEVSANRVLGITEQGDPTFYPDPEFDNYNAKNTIQGRSTSILPGSTLFMSPDTSCAELSTDSGSKIGLGFIDESGLSLAFSSESELTELKSVAIVDGMSCDLNQGMCLTDQSQSFSMHTNYQWQDLNHAMTPMLETLGQDNVNKISFQRDEVAHSVDPSFGDISKHIGEARKTLDRNIMKYSQEGHAFGCTVPKNVTETEIPDNPFSDNAQQIIKRKSKTVKSKLKVVKSESKAAESETKKTRRKKNRML